MQLRDLMQEILEKKFPQLPVTRRPRALANEIDTGEMDIRRGRRSIYERVRFLP